MLAAAKCKKDIECVSTLFYNSDPRPNLFCKDDHGNSLLHIAAAYNNNNMLEIFVWFFTLFNFRNELNQRVDLLLRNRYGQTALSICTNNKNIEGMKFFD